MIGRRAGTTSESGLCGVRTTTGVASSGSHCSTGSSSPSLPSSTSSITAAAVIGLVSEAIRKMESRAIGVVDSTAWVPSASTVTPSPRASSATAPGTVASFTYGSSRSRSAVIAGWTGAAP